MSQDAERTAVSPVAGPAGGGVAPATAGTALPGTVSQGTGARDGAGDDSSRRWLILGVVCLGQLMVVLDTY